MTSLHFTINDIPDLHGKRVIISGASAGIGLAAAEIFATKGAWVLNLDLNPPEEGSQAPKNGTIEYRRCDVSSWEQLTAAFHYAGNIDIAVANAGICEETNYFEDAFDSVTGNLIEPEYRVLDINIRAVCNFTKLALSHFRKHSERAGSIVINSSATAYAPEQSLPVFSASKLAVRIYFTSPFSPWRPHLSDLIRLLSCFSSSASSALCVLHSVARILLSIVWRPQRRLRISFQHTLLSRLLKRVCR